MTIAEFGLTPQASLVSSLPQIRLEQPSPGSETLANQYEALCRLSLSLVSLSPEELARILAVVLRPVLSFDFLDLVVFKEGTSEVLWHSVGAGQLPTSDIPMEESTYWWVYQKQQPLYIADVRRDEGFMVRREALKRLGAEYRSLCRLPLRAPNGSLGVLSVASLRPHGYSAEEMRFLSLTADQVAMAVANALYLERSRRTQSELDVQNARFKLLADVTNRVANLELDDLLREVTVGARRVIQSDFAVAGLLDPENGRLQVNAFDLPDNVMLDDEAVDSLAAAIGARAIATGKPWCGQTERLAAMDDEAPSWALIGFKNFCVLPLAGRDGVLGFLALGKSGDTAYTQDEVDFLTQVSSQVAIAVEKDIVYRELRKLKDGFGEERVCLEEEIGCELNFEEIVGRSVPLQRVLRQVEVVAPTDSGVLIQGETGTGKELIARAIHNLSSRRDRPFIKLNCAAIPSGLLESELFGHEKGAFTGAIMRKAGRFEVADKGTLFLDEVGDIPLDLQPKLLRVLQEREFERLGSTRTQQVDVRVIAATHRDLKQMCEDGEFRSDLFYRLHVFPLPVPPLRDRREDIPILVRHYVDKYARRMNRRIESIPSHAMEVFASYAWPGNVRELQNFIERAVILSPGSVLRPPLAELKQATVHTPSLKLSSLEEVEREHVLRAIRESNWVIGGPNGAAARLRMKRTTLAYRIRKLNIPCRPS